MIRFRQYLIESKNGLRKKVGLEFLFGPRTLILNNVTDIPIKSKDGQQELDNFFKDQPSTLERHDTNKFNKSKFVSLFSFQDMKKNHTVVFILFVRGTHTIVTSKKLHRNLKIKGGTESLNLKPQSLGIKERMTYIDFVQSLRKKVLGRKDLNQKIKDYLTYLIDDAEKISSSLPNVIGLSLAQIGKNFGELTGAIKLFNSNTFSIKFHKPNDIILFPLGGNNKLLDFSIEEENGIIHNFSSKYKSGAATSLTAIIDIMKENQSKFSKLKKELEVANIIYSNSAEKGVILLAVKLSLMTTKQQKLWNDGDFDDNEFEIFKQEMSPNLDKAITKFWILSGIAKQVARSLNDSYDFNKLIRKAMALSSVHQLSMVITSTGIPSYQIASSKKGKKESKKWQIDVGKSFFASSSPVQKISFKLK